MNNSKVSLRDLESGTCGGYLGACLQCSCYHRPLTKPPCWSCSINFDFCSCTWRFSIQITLIHMSFLQSSSDREVHRCLLLPRAVLKELWLGWKLDIIASNKSETRGFCGCIFWVSRCDEDLKRMILDDLDDSDFKGFSGLKSGQSPVRPNFEPFGKMASFKHWGKKRKKPKERLNTCQNSKTQVDLPRLFEVVRSRWSSPEMIVLMHEKDCASTHWFEQIQQVKNSNKQVSEKTSWSFRFLTWNQQLECRSL